MKAVVFHDVSDIRLDEVDEPRIKDPTDAIVRLTSSAICGTDLHFVRGSFEGMDKGTILGHEGVGVVEEVGDQVRNFRAGDRVVICSTIACGSCAYCRAGYFSQCDNANPNGSRAGTAFFGGPAATGLFDGLQAEKARIPWAHTGMVKIPDGVTDDQAILISDIFPTGYFGADIAGIRKGHTLVVFGCGPVGLAAIISARLMGAGRIIAVDHQTDRLAMAQRQGAEIVDFDREDPVETIVALTGGIGPDCAIDAVGIDAEQAHTHPAQDTAPPDGAASNADETTDSKADKGAGTKSSHDYRPGDAPAQVLQWAVKALAKGGTLSIIGVYPPDFAEFPIGAAMNKNLTLRMGNCPHRKYVPRLLDMVAAGVFDPAHILSHDQPMVSAIQAYATFDERKKGWLKVELEPQSA